MKRILSILLTALMVVTIIPVSVFMASAETVAIGDKNLAAGETYEYELDLADVDTTKSIVLKFNVTQATSVDGALSDNAVLSINGSRTLRVTGNNAMHIWDEANGATVTGSPQWNNCNAAQDVVVTIDVANNTANFVYNNRNVTLTSLDLSGDKITFKFGGANTPALVLAGISVEYTPVAAEEPEVDTLLEVGATNFSGWSNGSYVEKTVNTNGTNGLITIVFTPARNNWQSAYNLLSVNGVSIIKGAASGGVGYTMGSTPVAGWTARVITITIDPKTGDVTMVDTQGNEGTANVGSIGSSFALKINQDQTNSWELTSLTVTQVKGAVEDTQSRESYNYYYNDFTTENSNSGLISSYSNKGSSVVEGALCVNPTEVNQWNNANAVFPSGVVFKFDFMLPVLPTGEQIVKLLFDRTAYDYFIHVTESGVVMNGGTPVNTVAIEANKYYTATIVMADTGSVVYVDGTLVGTCAKTLSGRPNNYGLFNFNANAGDNTLAYYIDNIAITDVADETFVKVVGYQKTNVDNGTYSVRFTVAVPDLYAGEECIGFDIEAPAYSKTWNKTTTTVYTSLTANYGTDEVLASDEGAKYITAMALTGLPASEGTIELVIKPYVVINGIKVYGTAITLTVNPVQ